MEFIREIVREEAEFDLESFERESNKLKRSLRRCNKEERMRKIRKMFQKVNNMNMNSTSITTEKNDGGKGKSIDLDDSSSPLSEVYSDQRSSSKKMQEREVPNYSKNYELPNSVSEKIKQLGGVNATFIIQKTLYKTDLNAHHGRLSIPKNQIESLMFLTSEEIDYLESDGDANGRPKFVAGLIEPSGKIGNIQFGTWKMGMNKDTTKKIIYKLSGTWNGVVAENNFKLLSLIQVWAFRVESQLCFAIVPV